MISVLRVIFCTIPLGHGNVPSDSYYEAVAAFDPSLGFATGSHALYFGFVLLTDMR